VGATVVIGVEIAGKSGIVVGESPTDDEHAVINKINRAPIQYRIFTTPFPPSAALASIQEALFRTMEFALTAPPKREQSIVNDIYFHTGSNFYFENTIIFGKATIILTFHALVIHQPFPIR